jgi:hypothetical protein
MPEEKVDSEKEDDAPKSLTAPSPIVPKKARYQTRQAGKSLIVSETSAAPPLDDVSISFGLNLHYLLAFCLY